jgi:uncharacterized membrane protein
MRRRCVAGLVAVPVVALITSCATVLEEVGGDHSAAAAISDSGLVVGTVAAEPGQRLRGFLRRSDGTTVTFGDGIQSFEPAAVNDDGVVVGQRSVPGLGGVLEPSAIRWTAAGGAVDLPPAAGPFSRATDVNRDGMVTGVSGDASVASARATVWAADGTPALLPLGPDAQGSVALAINDRGTVVGKRGDSTGGLRLFRWSAGTVRLLPGGPWAAVLDADVDEDGTVVAWVEGDSGRRSALVWAPDATEPEPLPGEGNVEVHAVRNGVAVGGAVLPGGPRAVRWHRAGTWVATELGGKDSVAHGVNLGGAMVGVTRDDAGAFRAARFTV